MTDAESNVYIVGQVDVESGGPIAILTIKYAPDGTELWQDLWQGDADHPWNYGSGVAVGPDGSCHRRLHRRPHD